MLNLTKHKFHLVQILKEIYSDSSMASLLGLKGGAAAYLFYELPRFSVDLDFDLLNSDKKELVFKRSSTLIRKFGTLKEERGKRFTLFFLLSYGEEEHNIKIEVSTRIFPSHYEVKNYLGIPMLVMRKEDLFAHKLVALLERKEVANRDLFDLWFFMKNNWEVNKALVELRTKLKFKKYLESCLKAVKKVDERYILQGLGEILDARQKTWARKELKQDLSFLLNFYLENF